MTVWYEPGPEVDLVMDIKNLTFRPGSVDAIYAFHVLDHFFQSEVKGVLENWKLCLKPKIGVLYVVVDDFDVITRSYISGDFPIEFFNEHFTHPTYFTRDNLLNELINAGFKESAPIIWYGDVPDQFKKAKHELIFQISNG